jgi:hypothetical protein
VRAFRRRDPLALAPSKPSGTQPSRNSDYPRPDKALPPASLFTCRRGIALKGHIRSVSDSSTDMQDGRVEGHASVPNLGTSGINDYGTYTARKGLIRRLGRLYFCTTENTLLGISMAYAPVNNVESPARHQGIPWLYVPCDWDSAKYDTITLLERNIRFFHRHPSVVDPPRSSSLW